jgi:hypothetical protein
MRRSALRPSPVTYVVSEMVRFFRVMVCFGSVNPRGALTIG